MEITEKQKEKIEELAKKYQLKLILLFGSRVDGKIHKESDYDVAYLPLKKLSFDQENYLNYDFTGIFHHNRVDTIDIGRAKPLLLFGVFRKCQVLYQQNDLIFPTYRAYVFKKYIESKPFYEEKFRRLKEEIKKIKI
ncbi:MAG: nucleotidyltransferase domain-containing protein [Patescibacteria group bacterium]